MADLRVKTDLLVSGDVTFDQDVIVTGDLTVNGTETIINTTNLNVTDANITINDGGDDASSEGSGITVERTGTDGSIVYEDALASKFKVGAVGSEVQIADVSTAQTITNKTIDGASNTLNIRAADQDSAAASAGHVLTADGAAGASYSAPAAAPEHAYQLTNVGFAASAAAGALTLALKQADGSTDASGGAPVSVAFRSTTVTEGGFTLQSYTAAESVVVPVGGTLGYASGTDAKAYLYAIYDGTNLELAVSSVYKDETALHSTTAVGAGSDDSSLFSTSARTGAAIRLLGRVDVDAITTAGTWTTPDRAALNQYGIDIVPEEYLSAKATTTVTVSADTYLNVAAHSITLTPGEWEVGYDITAELGRVLTSGTVLGSTRLTSSGTEIDETVAALGADMDSAGPASVLSIPVSRKARITLTGSVTLRSQVRCNLAAATGTVRVYADAFTGGLTDNDNNSVMWARRVKSAS